VDLTDDPPEVSARPSRWLLASRWFLAAWFLLVAAAQLSEDRLFLGFSQLVLGVVFVALAALETRQSVRLTESGVTFHTGVRLREVRWSRVTGFVRYTRPRWLVTPQFTVHDGPPVRLVSHWSVQPPDVDLVDVAQCWAQRRDIPVSAPQAGRRSWPLVLLLALAVALALTIRAWVASR
jgi:hypothetical protein